MASSSKRWANIASRVAAYIHFFIIIFQVPLFRAPCRIGTCKSPLLVVCSQLVATRVLPAFVASALLYPGAIARAFVESKSFPSYRKLFKLYDLTNLVRASAVTDLQHLEILAGSYLSVGGAVLGLFRPGRMSLFGELLIIWGCIRDAILRRYSVNMIPVKTIHIYPAIYVAVLCAFLTIRKDVRHLIRGFRPRRGAKSLQFKAKNS